MNRRLFLIRAGLFAGGPSLVPSFTNLPSDKIMTEPFELISHHLCPFLHRSVILLTKKGLTAGKDFTVTRYPVYDFPKRVYDLSPKGHTPILLLNDGRVLLHSVAFNAYFDETIAPSFFPEEAFARAEDRGLILVCGDLLTQMRIVYTAKDDESLTKAIDKLFAGVTEVAPQLQSVMAQHGQPDAQMVEAAFAGFFTLMLTFDRLKSDSRWEQMTALRHYADTLVADPVVVAAKSPDYLGEFDRFFNHFGSAFKLVK